MADTAEAETSELAYGPTDWDDHHHLPTNTGLTNEKVTMWAFLGSDCLLFGALISTYLFQNADCFHAHGAYPKFQ